MSKKSRRRNKRILGALGALGLGLALANRGKGTEMSNISVGGGKDAATMKTGTGKTIMDNMPVKKSAVTNVTRPNLSRMEGSGPNSGEIGQKIRRDYIQRTKDAQNAAMMRAIRSNEAYRGNMMTSPDSILEGMDPLMISAKKGGRIVKGKKTAVRKVGIAKRGFGRAMKRSK